MEQVDAVYDIAVYGDSIWCAYPTSHTVKRFSLEDGSLEVSISDGEIGMDRGSLFCYPESLTRLGNRGIYSMFRIWGMRGYAGSIWTPWRLRPI